MAQTELKSTQLADSPAANEVLTSDGDANEWVAVGALVAPGADTQVIFNDGGVLAGDAGMVYAKATDTLDVNGAVTVATGAITATAGAITAGLGNITATAGAITAGTTIDSGTTVTAGTSVNATTYAQATTYIETGLDFRVISTTANSGGGLKRMFSEATSGALTGATDTIEVNVPAGSRILGCQLRVDTAVTGPAQFNAAYVTGSAQVIGNLIAAAKNTKVNTMYDANIESDIATNEVDIILTAIIDNFTGGVVRAIVYYETFIAMDNNP